MNITSIIEEHIDANADKKKAESEAKAIESSLDKNSIAVRHNDWKKLEDTRELISFLRDMSVTLTTQAKNLALINNPQDLPQISAKLIRAQEIDNIIEYVSTKTYPA